LTVTAIFTDLRLILPENTSLSLVRGRMNRRATIFHAGRAAGLNYAMPSHHLAHAVRDLVLASWGVDLPPFQDKGEGDSR
jgi:hypothetical protein